MKIYCRAISITSEKMLRRVEAFPKKPPFTLNKILDTKYFPKELPLPFQPYQAKEGREIALDWEESGFFIEAITQKNTGLPMVIWVLEKWVSIKFCSIAVSSSHTPWPTASIENSVLVSVGKHPKFLFGETGESLEKMEDELLMESIRNNAKIIRKSWSGTAGSADLYKGLKKSQYSQRETNFKYS